LASLELSGEQPDLIVRADRIVDVAGTASIVHVRGSARFLFDLQFQFFFEVERTEKTASGYPMQTSSSGQVLVADFSHDRRQDFSARVEGPDIAAEIAEHALLPRLKDALLACIVAYEAER